jgi:hypothetical protein
MSLQSPSRRSFLKKSTVLAVGVSSLTLFTGLVDAATVYDSICLPISSRRTVDGVVGDYTCTLQKSGPGECSTSQVCGTNASGASVTVTCGGASKSCKNLDPNFQ